MTTSITDATDTTTDQIIEAVLAVLRTADARGVRFLSTAALYRPQYGPRFREALRAGQRAGRIATRRVRIGNHRRRRFVALPTNAGFLPKGGAR